MTETKPTYTIENCQGDYTACLNTPMLADLLEHITALELVVDSKEQAIDALRARIAALEADLREYQE